MHSHEELLFSPQLLLVFTLIFGLLSAAAEGSPRRVDLGGDGPLVGLDESRMNIPASILYLEAKPPTPY